MRKTLVGILFGVAWTAAVCAEDLNTKWAYHNDGIMDRAQENVPGQSFAFLGNGSATIKDSEPITLYVLTANNFAGDRDEQVFARWWNGSAEHWIMGSWMTNVYIGFGDGTVGQFKGQPEQVADMVDVWKIEVSPDVTLPGDNYYVIQMKGWREGETPSEVFLLRTESADNPNKNNLGQPWTGKGDYFEHDWSVQIEP